MNIGETTLAFLNSLNKNTDYTLATNIRGENIPLKEAFDQCGSLFKQSKTDGNKVIFIGNGGSAAIASHQATDFFKNGKLKAVAFNDSSLLTCLSNDYGYEQVFSEPIKRFASKNDVLVSISSSGQSPNIIKATETAKEIGCQVITLSGFKTSNPLRSLGETNFYIPSTNYGIVEVSHLSLLHAMLESYIHHSQSTKLNFDYDQA